MHYIDTHSHLHFDQFNDDREAIIDTMRQKGVTTIAVGTGLATSRGAVALAQQYPDVVVGATIGVHPTDFEEDFVAADYEPLLKPRTSDVLGVVVGVGECGLDYFRTPRAGVFDKQKALFESHIQFALQHDLPLMLHVRPSKGSDDAHDDALAILNDFKIRHGVSNLRGTAHFFTGSLHAAQGYWNLGFCTSFPGVITFAKETQQVVREAPINLILSETDAPYAAPVPYRGSRCEPLHVIEVVHKIAQIKNLPLEDVSKQLVTNARRTFLAGTP